MVRLSPQSRRLTSIPQPGTQKPPPGYFMHDSHGLMPISSSPDLFTRFPDPGSVTMYGSGREHRAFQPSAWLPPENWDMLPDSDVETGDYANQNQTPLPQTLTQIAKTEGTMPAPPPMAPIDPGYWTNPDTGQVIDIEGEMGPQYQSTIPMGHSPYVPNEGFFSKLGRRLTSPFKRFTDISDVPAFGSGIAATARTLGPVLASSFIPGAGLLSLLASALPDSGATPYEMEGAKVTDISFGPNQAWLGADVPGGGYYIQNQKIDMTKLGGGERAGGRDITVHTPEGLVDATYRVNDGVASITSDDFGVPGVDYGDIYYGGADYEGLDISDDGSGDQWDAYWGDW